MSQDEPLINESAALVLLADRFAIESMFGEELGSSTTQIGVLVGVAPAQTMRMRS